MKRVVITGATSMIGAALARHCIEEGVEVFAVVRENSKRLSRLPVSPLLHLVRSDIGEYLENLPSKIGESCDVFYHFAWSNTGEAKFKSIYGQTENINGTLTALEAAQKLGCHLFVGAGSQAEYGPQDCEKISVETPVKPVLAYGICKYAAGKLVQIEAEKLGIAAVWVRIFSVYGENDKNSTLIMQLVHDMLCGQSTALTACEQLWDYLYSEDAARAFYLIGDKCKKSAYYCLGSGQAHPLREYVKMTAAATGYKGKIGFGEKSYSPNQVMNLCADIEPLTKDTGFVPSYTFTEGIQRVVDYWKKRFKEDNR